MKLTYLKLRPNRTETISPEAQLQFLGSFLPLGRRKWFEPLLGYPKPVISLEIWNTDQRTKFYLTVPENLSHYLTGQIIGHYPKVIVEPTEDPSESIYQGETPAVGVLKQAYGFAYPLKTFKGLSEQVLSAAVIGTLGKIAVPDRAGIQILTRVVGQTRLIGRIRSQMEKVNAEGVKETSPDKSIFDHKLSQPIVECQIRLVYQADNHTKQSKLKELSGAFGVFTASTGNSLNLHRFIFNQDKSLVYAIKQRSFLRFAPKLLLNLEELATIWHLPDMTMKYLTAIDWGKTAMAEAPDNLPVAEHYSSQDERRLVNFFGKTEWHNHETTFGIKNEDRRRHVYIVGKTGAGKSTLIANMAINDIRNGHGVAVIDPHGDLSEMILNYIPKRRLNDVIYLDPTVVADRSFVLNLFDDQGLAHTDVVAAGIISVFRKLYAHSWGPRLEYILRNSVLTLLYTREATFADIITLLTQPAYRSKVVTKLLEKDQQLAGYWTNEFEKMNDKLRTESISPILNKVGQFVSSQRIRHVVGQPQSTVSLSEVMDQGKILILNLSQGKLGEDTTALLGAMFITKMQLTAMQRVNLPEKERRDFYLYIDEFQNFATEAFINILSEARKYHLNLILANQYVEQVDETIQKALFGNIGSLITFVVGARDATMLSKELGNVFTEEELVSLGKYQILLKMAIDGLTSEPFTATTLPLPAVVNANKDKIIQQSVERYYQKWSA